MKPKRKRAKWRQGLFMVLLILCPLSAFEFALADTKHTYRSDASSIEKGGTVLAGEPFVGPDQHALEVMLNQVTGT